MTQNVAQRPPLFRQEAIEFQQHNRQWGRVVPLQPLSTRVMVWSVTTAVAAIVTFLFVAQYARKETVAGYLTPSSGTAKVFAPHQGAIGAVHVAQGQRVERGQPVLTVAVDHVAADGEDVAASILAALSRQRESLARQMAAEDRRAASERNRLIAQIHGFEVGLAQLVAQIGLQQQRVGVAERLLASAGQLSPKGLVSDAEQKRREEALLEQRSNLNALHQQATERRGQITEAQHALEQLPAVTGEKLQALGNEISAVDQRVAEVNGRRAYVVRAPIAGRVSSLQASVGRVADPRQMQLEIVPDGGVLHAELFVPPRAIGFVEVGQSVRLLYEAFPYQHYGTYRGRITAVSQTALSASDVTVPLKLAEPSYRVIVALERPDVDAYGKRVPLQPDMLLKADIILEKRTLVDWLLNPLLSARIQG